MRQGRYKSNPSGDGWEHIGSVTFIPNKGSRASIASGADESDLGWGYVGNGPFALSRYLLRHALGYDPDRIACQDFMIEFVSRLPRGSWSVDTEQVKTWVSAWTARHGVRRIPRNSK